MISGREIGRSLTMYRLDHMRPHGANDRLRPAEGGHLTLGILPPTLTQPVIIGGIMSRIASHAGSDPLYIQLDRIGPKLLV
jgi:hypothetical protein